MIIFSLLHESFVGFAAILACIGFGMLFVRKAAGSEAGPGYWTISFFLNAAGFVCWAGTQRAAPVLLFAAGDAFHMLGFVCLVCGVYRFTGNAFEKWNLYALAGLAIAWTGAIILMPGYRATSFFLLMGLRSILFIWSGQMILKNISRKSVAGRNLAGWGVLGWGIYVLLFPFIWRLPWLVPLAFGLLVGLHALAGMGMVVLIVDRMRIRAENSEHQVQRLEGLLPICSHCKKIRDPQDHWHRIETYIRNHSDVQFSHGICPECSDRLYGAEDWYVDMKKEKNKGRDTSGPGI